MSLDLHKHGALGKAPDADDVRFVEQEVGRTSALFHEAQKEIEKEVWGQTDIVRAKLEGMLTGGHILGMGNPGLAKTFLVSRLARVLNLDSKRIQGAPDLMPGDILGYELLKPDQNGHNSIVFVPGPIFSQILHKDEDNRMPPRTQAAVLQAMQERKVTTAGETRYLPNPHIEIATQNYFDEEGTYSTPFAQKDRYLIMLNYPYPDEAAERRIALETTSTTIESLRALYNAKARGEDLSILPNQREETKLKPVLEKHDLVFMQELTRMIALSDKSASAIVNLVRSARPGDDKASPLAKKELRTGPGPRALQAFALMAKAKAVFDGRTVATVDDVLSSIGPVLEHRLMPRNQTQFDFGEFKRDLLQHTKLG